MRPRLSIASLLVTALLGAAFVTVPRETRAQAPSGTLTVTAEPAMCAPL